MWQNTTNGIALRSYCPVSETFSENAICGRQREADRKTLRQVIEEARDPNLLIVRDKNAPAYVAVTTEAAKKLVEQFIDRRTQTASAIPDLDALPRAVLLAFCVRPESGKTVFLRTSPPFKYEIAERLGEDSNHFLPVDERYRRPGLTYGFR